MPQIIVYLIIQGESERQTDRQREIEIERRSKNEMIGRANKEGQILCNIKSSLIIQIIVGTIYKSVQMSDKNRQRVNLLK